MTTQHLTCTICSFIKEKEKLKEELNTKDTEITRLTKIVDEQQSKIHLLEERIKRRDKTIDKNKQDMAKKQDEIKQKIKDYINYI